MANINPLPHKVAKQEESGGLMKMSANYLSVLIYLISPFLNVIAYEMMSPLKMSNSFMKDYIFFCYRYNTDIITHERNFVVCSILAKRFILGMATPEKAKAFDEMDEKY
jgi:hypothetical protein